MYFRPPSESKMLGLLFVCSPLCLFFICYSLFRKSRNRQQLSNDTDCDSASDSDSDSGKASWSVILSRCVERRTFVYHNPSPRKIVYYVADDVTFVCFDDPESAVKLVNLFHGFRGHDRVLEARFQTYDAGLKKHIVCFERFDGFLADPAFLARLANPNFSQKVPGNPKESVQLEIKALSEALEHMLSRGVSSKTLHLPIGYVWCQGNSGDPPKLKIIILDFEEREDQASEQWNKIISRAVKCFGTVLDTYFLKTDVVWPQKDSFLRCFSIRLPEENRRLHMIRNHPFLKNNIGQIFQIFTRIHRDFRAGDPDVLRLRKLMAALNGRQFKSEFMPSGVWTRQEMSPQFIAFLRGDCKPPSNSVKYNTQDMGDLLRLQRNLYENFYHSMTLDFMFKEVVRYWPHLIDRVYEKIAALHEGGSSWYY